MVDVQENGSVQKLFNIGGFQLEFVRMSQVMNHMTCLDLSALIGGKFI